MGNGMYSELGKKLHYADSMMMRQDGFNRSAEMAIMEDQLIKAQTLMQQ